MDKTKNRLDEAGYVRDQYKTQDNLSVRIRTHQLYGEPKQDFTGWVLDQISWQGDEQVIDVGCGAGVYVEPASERASFYVAGDLSLGMLQALDKAGLSRVNLDVQRLPLAANSFDVVLANHMLYHVPDKEAALAGITRVLRPGGRLLAATNSATNMGELDRLSEEAFAALGVATQEEVRPTLDFTLENGATILKRYFDHVERRDLPGALVFHEAQPVIDYLATTRARFDEQLAGQATWDRLVAQLRRIVEAEIAASGEYRVHKLTGVFVCWSEVA